MNLIGLCKIQSWDYRVNLHIGYKVVLKKWGLLVNQIVTVFEIFNIPTVMWNLIVWQKFSVHLYVSGFQWMRCDTDKNFAKFCQILTSRFCDNYYCFSTYICLWKSTKQRLSPFSLSLHPQHLCMHWGHTIWQKQQKQNKFLQITFGSHIFSGKSHCSA